MSRIGILGAGAFGTGLAVALGDRADVVLWARDPAHAEALTTRRENARRLPGTRLPARVMATADLGELATVGAVLMVLPAQTTAEFLARHGPDLPPVPLVLCAKGLSRDGEKMQSEVAAGHGPLAVLTGPGFAAEIAAGKPTALTLAGPDGLARDLQVMLARRHLRLYRSSDMIGAQLGGALKNVIAIAAGIAVGAGLGESARAAVMTRGFAEMRRLAAALGARDETLAGLSGFGDLALTCGSEKSRNFAHGVALGAGAPPRDVTVEGTATARAATRLAMRAAVEMPIAEAVADVLDGGCDVVAAMSRLLDRPQGKEE